MAKERKQEVTKFVKLANDEKIQEFEKNAEDLTGEMVALEEGEAFIGTLIDKTGTIMCAPMRKGDDPQELRVYTFRTEDGEVVRMLGKTKLDQGLLTVNPGDEVCIKRLQDTKSNGGFHVHDFRVAVRRGPESRQQKLPLEVAPN